MLTVDEAFRKFKSRLELNDREQQNASKRHKEVRDHINSRFSIDRDFLTGSYARHTKTKPLKDIYIFFVILVIKLIFNYSRIFKTVLFVVIQNKFFIFFVIAAAETRLIPELPPYALGGFFHCAFEVT